MILKILNYYGLELISDKTLCPFHLESNPSLDINFETELFYCFGCGARGDIIDLVAKLEDCNRLQALYKIYKINNDSFKHNFVFKGKRRNWTKEAYIEYKNLYKPNWEMPNYLTGRGFTPDFLSKFGVKINPLSDYKFIIPLKQNSRFKGFVRRTEDDRENKYINNRGFKRNKVLIGSYSKGRIFVAEGILDYMKAVQFGIQNICCLLGWKASKFHINLLKKNTNTIIAALDNDKRGGEGTKFLKKYFNTIEFPYPKNIKDIGEMNEKMFYECYKKITGRRNEKIISC